MNLTDKERRAIALADQGLTVRQIARELHLSPETVKSQRRFTALKQEIIRVSLENVKLSKEINRLCNLLYQIENVASCDMAAVLARKRSEHDLT